MLPVEKYFIGCYQDVHFWNDQKYDWNFGIPEDWKDKPWCYVINSKCRFPEFYLKLMSDEKELIDTAILHLDNAISRSRVKGNPFIFRGVFNLDWLENSNVGGIFEEKGFGSFSLDISRSYQYTDSENPIIFQLELDDEMEALYIDGSEREVLRPRNVTYEIVDVVLEKIYFSKSISRMTIVYKIKEIKGHDKNRGLFLTIFKIF
ncbi:hypothetical protein MmiHf6_12240 [Methanimicrococcus hongohii]|uniref:ADP ribosyltransferase domain-containing protein n=1 Tax=Methanimicrococcus hongohii TaxID=3028295 RepID=A0AA96ZU47_9EURY|nr:ADP-ribosyltransferase [Methanimicrococcus sp. Hf6]WNY23901.1 hypothetical protein MmiHf6_12240 [Methanimicrococcus sp. Hf6]